MRAVPAFFLALILIFSAGCTAKNSLPSNTGGSVSMQAQTAPSSPAAQEDFGNLDDYDDESGEYAAENDPLEGWNRFWFHVNDFFLQNIVKPLHKGYAFIVPESIRGGISAFAHNAAFPVRMLNSLLQGEFAQAGVEFDRSLVNFMVSFGFADVASQNRPLYPYRPETENFDFTLNTWGVPDGPYFIIPFLGPSTVRGAAGEAGDMFMKPQFYLLDWEVSTPISVSFAFNSADNAYKPYDQITQSAIEPYIALRNAYLSSRRNTLQRMTLSSNTQD